jgi:type I restriction enzyme S subunit
MLSENELSKICEYRPQSAHVFCKVKEKWGGFSNMSNDFPVNINSVAIKNTEALYQALRYPDDSELQQKIIEQNGGYSSKLASKPHRESDKNRADWEVHKVNIMRYVLRVKLAQNFDTFGELLTESGTQPIVELSRRDAYWGCKIIKGTENLLGQNVLGKLLMELREEYVIGSGCAEGRESLRYVPPLAIPDFYLYGKPIEAVGEQPNP